MQLSIVELRKVGTNLTIYNIYDQNKIFYSLYNTYNTIFIIKENLKRI